MFILISVGVLTIIAIAYLIYKGRYSQNGIVWTARMGDDD